MRRTIVVFVAGALAAAGAALAQPRPEHGLDFKTPVTTWDEAIPLGNGMLGALLWGDGSPVKLSLDRADLWDLRPVPEFQSPEYRFDNVLRMHRAGQHDALKKLLEDPYNRPAPTKIPAGRIEITLPSAKFTATRLDLAEARGSIEFANGDRLEALVHAGTPVGIVEVRSAAEPGVKLIAPPFSGKVENAASGGISPGDLRQLGYPAPRVEQGDSFQAYSQTGWGGFRFAVHVGWRRRMNGWMLAWSISSTAEGKEPERIARARVENALMQGYPAMKSAHVDWWRRFWAQSSVRVPNPVLERMWHQETYKFGSTARRDTPPISLQAIWTADNGQLPPWKGDYHHDLNTELSYWPAYTANHMAEEYGYIDWLWKTRQAAFAWTSRFYQMPGVNVPMTSDLDGNQIGGWRQYTHSATTAAWLAHHFYMHWKYSGDREFLRSRAYPYVQSATLFLDAYTAAKGPDGKRTHPLSSSPEINDNKPNAWFDVTTNYDLALERWLFQTAAEMARELGLKDEATRWKKVLDELAPFAEGEDGRLLVAPEYALPGSHRHFSHLMAIHPLGLIDWEDGDRARRTINASLAELDRLGSDWWTGYSFAWLANLSARARNGEKAEKALEIFATAFCLRNGFHVNGDQSGRGYSKFKYRPFTLEGNFAAAAGLQEMLLQSHRGVIRIFPAVPAKWRDVSFDRFRAEGGFLVSAERRGGKVTRLEIGSVAGGEAIVAHPETGKKITVRIKPGQTQRVL